MKHLIEKLKEQIANSIEYGNDLDAASWGMQEGVLITAIVKKVYVNCVLNGVMMPMKEAA